MGPSPLASVPRPPGDAAGQGCSRRFKRRSAFSVVCGYLTVSGEQADQRHWRNVLTASFAGRRDARARRRGFCALLRPSPHVKTGRAEGADAASADRSEVHCRPSPGVQAPGCRLISRGTTLGLATSLAKQGSSVGSYRASTAPSVDIPMSPPPPQALPLAPPCACMASRATRRRSGRAGCQNRERARLAVRRPKDATSPDAVLCAPACSRVGVAAAAARSWEPGRPRPLPREVWSGNSY